MDKEIERFHDIVEADAVSFWPLASGWWMVIGLILVGLCIWTWKAWRKFLTNAYRKQALQALSQASTPADVASILRRCVRVWLTGPELSELSEAEWLDLLIRTGGKALPEELAKNWQAQIYSSEPAEHIDLWKSFAQEWIRKHQPETFISEGHVLRTPSMP